MRVIKLAAGALAILALPINCEAEAPWQAAIQADAHALSAGASCQAHGYSARLDALNKHAEDDIDAAAAQGYSRGLVEATIRIEVMVGLEEMASAPKSLAATSAETDRAATDPPSVNWPVICLKFAH